MMLIMMIMMMMMMMMMVMLVMMLEMLVMAVVTVCYAFTQSLGHTVPGVISVVGAGLLSTPLPHLDVFDAESSACWLNGSEYIAACYQMTWSMSPMSSAWSTLSIVSAIVRLPHINVFDVVIVVVVVVVD